MIFDPRRTLILEYPEFEKITRHLEEQKLYDKLYQVFDISSKVDCAYVNTIFLTIVFHIIWFVFSLYGLSRLSYFGDIFNVYLRTTAVNVYLRTIAVMYIPSALGLIVFVYLTISRKYLDYKADKCRKLLNNFRINNTKEE